MTVLPIERRDDAGIHKTRWLLFILFDSGRARIYNNHIRIFGGTPMLCNGLPHNPADAV